MLLTIKQPAHQGYKSFHDYSPPTPPNTSRFSPLSSRFSPAVTSGPSCTQLSTTSSSSSNNTSKSLPPPIPARKSSTPQPMSTPHRGLPPPAAMTLPPHTQPPPPITQVALSQPMGQLPAPPQQWQGAEESMRNWLHAKAEEDKRKQEEEKTRQESLRLEQRKIEQDMLRTSLSGGIPPYMIPMVFAGMGGGNLPNASLEWAQHYMAQSHQLQQQQQQQQQLLASQNQTSPEQSQRRDSRAQPYGQHPAPMTLPSTPIGAAGTQQTGFPGYPISPRARAAQAQGSLPRQPVSGHLPRLNTGEMHIQPPPTGSGMQVLPGQPQHPLQQSQTVQQEPQSSPSIYFHHWQPPTTQAGTSGGNQPSTPSDHTSSPKKRKATGPQQPAPPPTSQPQYTSPPYSHSGSTPSSARRRGHSRQRSDMSARGAQDYRPGSRHRQTEGGFSHQGAGSPRGTSAEQGQAAPAEPRSGSSNPVSSILEQSDSRPRAQSQTQPREYQFSADPEMRHEETRRTPERKSSR